MAPTEQELREVQRKIDDLGCDEHSQLLKIIPGSMLTSNSNGAFCDLSKLEEHIFEAVRVFVDFSTDNNVRIAQYDRKLHLTSMMMQRHRSSDIPKSLPEFVKDVPVRSELMALQLVKHTPKMAFIKRSADMADRVTPMVVLEKEPSRPRCV